MANAVSLKLPQFWASDPALWFAQVEAQFATRNVTTDKTKFDYVIASLQPEVATEIRDLILQPPTTNLYKTLKTTLIDRTAASEQRRLQQLLTTEELGDRKPSQLLRHLQQLLGDKAAGIDKSFMRELFLQRLPVHVRMVLVSMPDTVTIEEMAALADKILEVATPSPVSAVTNSDFVSDIADLKAEITQLKHLLNRSSHRSHPRRSSHSRSRANSPAPVAETPNAICWYHQKFGDAAQKCKPPCSAQLGNSKASR